MNALKACGAGALLLLTACAREPAPANSTVQPVQERLLILGDSPARQAAFSKDGRLLALTNAGGDIFVLRSADWRPVQRLKHSGGATSVAFSPDSAKIYTAGYDGTVRQWGMSSSREGRRFGPAGGAIWSLDLSPDGKRMVAGGEDGIVRLWDTGAARAAPKLLRGHERNIWEVRFSPDGSEISSGSFDFTIRQWDAASGKERRILRGHSQAVVGLDYAPDGRMLATSGDDSAIRLWDRNGRQLRHIRAGNHAYKVEFSPDGRWIASAVRPRSGLGTAFYQLTGIGEWGTPLKLWRVSDGALLAALPQPADVGAVTISPDGRRVVSADDDGRVWIWRLPDHARS